MSVADLVGSDVRTILREHFGFRGFRPGQRRAVEAAIEGRDTIVLMPTGSGKSLCFQLPALHLPGTTVVVSPLIALMKDQADDLRKRGASVAVVNSTLSAEERAEAEENIRQGRVEFVYTTPETLSDPAVRGLLKEAHIDLFVVDEAHCLSRWGHDFRPEYLSLGTALSELGSPPVLALTATATDDVVDDIRRGLGLDDPEVIHTGFYRPNLELRVAGVADEEERDALLLESLKASEGVGIVYAATVKSVLETAERLARRGFEVAPYHGRMKPKDREVNQDRFMAGELKAIVATNAFGLGIDKPDIRFVIHRAMPGTIEAYYQEVGRAGRDGQPARGLLLHHPADIKLQRFLGGSRYPTGEDLVNAHHALKRTALQGDGAPFADVASVSPLAKTRLKVALALFASRGIATESGGLWKLNQPDLTPTELERVAGSYRERQERERDKQERMVGFTRPGRCRWSYLLDYFGSDELAGKPCGHCDQCL